jgi:hypothetical protein
LEPRRSQPLYSSVLRAVPPGAKPGAPAGAPSNLSRARSGSDGSSPGAVSAAAASFAAPGGTYAAVASSSSSGPAALVDAAMRSSREQLPGTAQATARATTPSSAGKPVLFGEDAAARQRRQQEGEGTPEEVGPAEYARLPLRLSRQVRVSSCSTCCLPV